MHGLRVTPESLEEMEQENRTVADIEGPWVDSDFESGLIERCKRAWTKPISGLTNQELATLLRQNIAVVEILPTAKKRITHQIDDDSEIFDGELQEAITNAEKRF